MTVIMFFARSILAIHVRGLRDPLVCRDPQFEKPCYSRGPPKGLSVAWVVRRGRSCSNSTCSPKCKITLMQDLWKQR